VPAPDRAIRTRSFAPARCRSPGTTTTSPRRTITGKGPTVSGGSGLIPPPSAHPTTIPSTRGALSQRETSLEGSPTPASARKSSVRSARASPS
jgi:hypothetical protein